MFASLNQVLSQGLVKPAHGWLTFYPKNIINNLWRSHWRGSFARHLACNPGFADKDIGPNNSVPLWVWLASSAVAGGILFGIFIVKSNRKALERQAYLSWMAQQQFQQFLVVEEQQIMALEGQSSRTRSEVWSRAYYEEQAIEAIALEQHGRRALEEQHQWERDEQNARTLMQVVQVASNRTVEDIQKFRQRPIRQEECTICFDPLQAPFRATQQNIDMLICGHTFHCTCIETWFRTSDECPICRTNYASQNVENVTGRCKRFPKKRRRKNRKQNWE